MLRNIKSLTIQDQTSRNELLIVLKEEAKKFTLQDIISCSLQIQQEANCIHTSYKKEYIKAETGFMIRIVEVKDDNFNYNGLLEVDELNTAINLLEEQEKMMEDMEDTNTTFIRIYSIISLYTTFIKDEPIHQVGTLFPGGFTVKKDGDKYTCPVKDNNNDNPLALCPFCIAVQDEEV
ncbi:DUF2115 family protein [Methanobacterium spitsbergense]|uniref:UPF0305 protein K8N75_10345 n=1 Tax=Methanobacterium spitsbergense TaxID=2874285 RepID=A0A8T5UX09_9EURY|nr:DUF2115 domain-containing protein [Methanobacterium spitsbergense]